MSDPPIFPRKLYGRRKGPKLSAHQARLIETLLPQLALRLEAGRDPKTYFAAGVTDVWLEIGFGGGEHFLWQADAHPDVGFIGAEPYVSGVAKLLSRLAAHDSLAPFGGEGGGEGELGSDAQPPDPDPLPPRGRGDSISRRGNIRLYTEDAREIVAALPAASLGRTFILFPDPWPKMRHHKRRFIQTETLDELARVMKTGAELRFATDDRSYLVWALERLSAHPAFVWLAQSPADWRTRPPDWPETRYEAKALRQGRSCTYLRFARR